MPLQTGLRFYSREYEQPPYQEARGTTNSKRLTCNRSSDNDLRPGRQDSCSNGFRANAAAETPSPTKDENQPFKLGRRRSRGANGADDLVGDEDFSSCHHLSSDDGSHLPTGRSPLKSSRTGEHRPPRRGVVLEHGQDSPRTRTPP
jgi:hypothetical protein